MIIHSSMLEICQNCKLPHFNQQLSSPVSFKVLSQQLTELCSEKALNIDASVGLESSFVWVKKKGAHQKSTG